MYNLLIAQAVSIILFILTLIATIIAPMAIMETHQLEIANLVLLIAQCAQLLMYALLACQITFCFLTLISVLIHAPQITSQTIQVVNAS
jgi:hypothetical protein